MYLRFYKPALLKFTINKLYIRGKAIKVIIPYKTIIRIYCNDAYKYDGYPKEQLTIQIQQKRKTPITIKLSDYSEAENFINKLRSITDTDIMFYNFSRMPTQVDEE